MNDTAVATLDRLVDESGELYSLPSVAMQVLELTSNPKIDAAKLKACIERDPALTMKLLRVVNSSLFGLKQQVSDLNQALGLLGIKPLKLLVLGFSLPDALFDDVAADVLNRYWKRTLTRAVAARELAEHLWHVPGDEAFIAGLLADLGMLVLIQELGQPYIELLAKVGGSGDYLTAIERHSLGFDHIQLTSRLFQKWALPRNLVEAVEACRPTGAEPADSPGQTPTSGGALSDLLHLAELTTLLLADERTDILPLVLSTARRLRGVTEQQFTMLVEQLQPKVAQLADVLSLTLPDGLAYCDILDIAHEQLVQVAASAAGDMTRAQFVSIDAQLDQFKLLNEVRELSEAVTKITSPKRQRRAGGAQAAADQSIRPASNATGLAPPHKSQPSHPPAGPADVEVARTEGKFEPTDVDEELLAGLTSAVASCRQSRCSLSLLLVEMDRLPDVVFSTGMAHAESLLADFEDACGRVDHPDAVCVGVREARCALILVDCDRRQAVSLGNELIRELRRGSAGAYTVSIGSASVALPPRNFPPQDLVSAADRCLYGARLAGGDTLKSIEIY